MAHELSITTTGKAEMAYVGETPWHGLGQSVTKGASLDVWAKEAGLDWEAKEAVPLFHCTLDKPGTLRSVSSNKVLYRSDSGAPLSVVGTDYKVVQPRDVLEFFRDMTESGGWHIHTAGALRGGRKIWAMATNNTFGTIGGKDIVYPHLLLATSLDGSLRTTAKLTATRVVCANTVAMALSDAGNQVRVSHRTEFDPRVVKRALGIASSSFEDFLTKAKAMAEIHITRESAREALDRIFFGEAPRKPALDLSWLNKLGSAPIIPDDAKESRVVTRALELFEGAGRGAQFKTSKGTRWGLFNAVTEMVDHEMGRSADTRVEASWFGRGDGFKTAAWKELSAV